VKDFQIAKQLFIAWVPFQRRSVTLKRYFGYELKFLTLSFKDRWLRPFEYVIKSIQTLIAFIASSPQVIWLQLPPTPLLYLGWLYKTLSWRKVQLIADCHNATFRSPWIRLPGVISLLNRCELVIVHNDWVADQAVKLGIFQDKLCVLEDPPAEIECDRFSTDSEFTHPWFLFPCSFNQDEPIATVIETACLLPEYRFVLTGNPARAKGFHNLANLPENLKLTGFLPKEDFDRLLCQADVVLGLTKFEGIQLSVANEAIGVGKPMVLSNMKTLKQLFYKGSVFVDSSSSESLAKGCQEALSNYSNLAQDAQTLRAERSKVWLEQAKESTILAELLIPLSA
jgi:glycosyltransferase involved in cell wall biosynthesis